MERHEQEDNPPNYEDPKYHALMITSACRDSDDAKQSATNAGNTKRSDDEAWEVLEVAEIEKYEKGLEEEFRYVGESGWIKAGSGASW